MANRSTSDKRPIFAAAEVIAKFLPVIIDPRKAIDKWLQRLDGLTRFLIINGGSVEPPSGQNSSR